MLDPLVSLLYGRADFTISHTGPHKSIIFSPRPSCSLQVAQEVSPSEPKFLCHLRSTALGPANPLALAWGVIISQYTSRETCRWSGRCSDSAYSPSPFQPLFPPCPLWTQESGERALSQIDLLPRPNLMPLGKLGICSSQRLIEV